MGGARPEESRVCGDRPERRVGRDGYKDLTLSKHGVLCVLILKLLMFYY